ncbi:hypothetical protein FACS1894219_09910 [Clostridia bacterium]|nr:hypothetical protein FACS1894219_09910 [Clostridia bacterium]
MNLKNLQSNLATGNEHSTIADKQDTIIERIEELGKNPGRHVIDTVFFNQSANNTIQIVGAGNITINNGVASAAHQSDDQSDVFADYLKKLKGKFSTIKILYADEPRPFRDFYVCNDIHHRTIQKGRYNSYSTEMVQNATIEKLADISNFLIINGTGGLGKSMMMRNLLLNAVDSYDRLRIVPIFVSLKDFDEQVTDIYSYAFSKIESLCDDITFDAFKALLTDGKCLFLFDGLDEMSSTVEKRFISKLEELTDKYPDNIFIISSRPAMFSQFQRFTILHLQPFNKKQSLELIDKLDFRVDEPAIKTKFRDLLEKTLWHTHSAFTENPLLLTIMLMTFEHFSDLYVREAQRRHLFFRG